MNKRRLSDEVGKKLTARYLVPVETSSDFRKNLEDVAEVIYQRRGRGNRLKKVVRYKIELCVVLI